MTIETKYQIGQVAWGLRDLKETIYYGKITQVIIKQTCVVSYAIDCDSHFSFSENEVYSTRQEAELALKEKQEKKLFELIDEVNNHGRLCGVRDYCFHEITRLCEILGYKHNLGLFKIDNK